MNIVVLLPFVTSESYGFFNELHKQSGIELFIICTTPGKVEYNRKTYFNEFILNNDKINKSFRDNVIKKADVILYSTHKNTFKNINKNALLLKFSERLLKFTIKGPKQYLHYLLSCFYHSHFFNRKGRNALLAIGGYTYGDYYFFNSFRSKAYKYGYIGEYEQDIFEDKNILSKHRTHNKKLLWVGSMNYDKKLFETLNVINDIVYKDGVSNFELNVCGDGYFKKMAIEYVNNNNLQKYVHFLGEINYDSLKKILKESNILIASGGRIEGFNCSLLLAFNYYCLCLANIACGSTIDLINNGFTGYSFSSFNELRELIISTINEKHYETTTKIINNAYRNLKDNWCCKIAAERFPIFVNSLIEGKETPFSEGVFSKATLNINIKKHYDSE